MTMLRIELRRKQGPSLWALADESDADLLSGYRWFAKVAHRRSGLMYAHAHTTRPDGTQTLIKMHQLVMGALGVDHRNGNGLDNRRQNLRLATGSQQGANRRPYPGGSSQYKGVSWHKSQGNWRAVIKVNRRSRHLGGFATEEEAARAYDEAAVAAFGEFAYLNFPDLHLPILQGAPQ